MDVLLVKLSSLGDVVHTLPAITDAARAHPGIGIDWIIEDAYRPVAALHSAVRNVVPIGIRAFRRAPTREWRRLRASIAALRSRNYDVAIDAQGLAKSALVGALARANGICGYDSRSAREPIAASLYRRRFSVARDRHAVERVRALFAQALGYPPPTSPPDFGIAEGSEGPLTPLDGIALLHGTTWPNKRWPDAFWRALAERAARRGLDVIVPASGDAERALAERIAQAHARVRVLPPLPLDALVRELARVRAAVSVDSGLGQLSAALGVPTIALYGPTDPKLTGCVGAHATNVAASFPCAPCKKRGCAYRGAPVLDDDIEHGRAVEPPCFSTVSVDAVFARLERVL